jgi:hypothetical protein
VVGLEVEILGEEGHYGRGHTIHDSILNNQIIAGSDESGVAAEDA